MSLRTRLGLALGYVVALVIIAFAVPLTLNLRDRVEDDVRSQARAQTAVLAAGAADLLTASPARGDLAVLARETARAARGRVTIVDRDGVVVADSSGTDEVGEAYGGRPELVRALTGERAQAERDSATLGTALLATADPVLQRGRVTGAVRLTQSVEAVDEALADTVRGILAVGLVVLGLGLLVALFLARTITRPILRLERAAGLVAAGDLDVRVTEEGSREQRALAGSFNAMTERVDRALGAQREFVADASHQLRTPLTGLRLRLEEARATEDRRTLHEGIDAGLLEVDRMAQMVEELLVLSRTGERELPGELLDTAAAAHDAAERWAPAAAAQGVTVTVDEHDPGTVWCARPDLDRALDVVIENALRYAPGGEALRIVAAAGCIDVLDDGPGIEVDEAEAVFARFHRGHAGRAVSAGTGLGLPIARALMRSWDGDATLDPRPEGGTRARLRLPVASEVPA